MVDMARTFGERLLAAMRERQPKAASITDVAEACGVSYQAAKKWTVATTSTAKLDALNAIQLSKYLGKSVDWLVTGREAILYVAAENAATYNSGPSFVHNIARFINDLNPILRPAASKIMQQLADCEITADAAFRDLYELQSMSASSGLRKQMGTG
ncbi:MAG: helix-turn-helix transcriptional regulator [Proteobacteria bacterium]|nr:helix-turn-helix transcriptional regulator [Pseudomonadota bacterium]